MTITSVGYAGEITDANLRRWATSAVGSMYGVDDFASWRVTPGSGDRAVQIAPGSAFGLGVRDTSDVPTTLSLPSVSSGSRWDLIVGHRDWSASETTHDFITGSSTKAIPGRDSGLAGTTDDQPLALVRVAAGQAAVQDIIDLRCIPGDGGMVAFDPLARSYLSRVGTQVRIGDFIWTRNVESFGNPTWTYVDVTPDTGWADVFLNSGWSWNFGKARRVGSQISVRLSAGRAVGWSPGNQLAVLSAPFRPDTDWYVGSSANSGKTEFMFAPDGSVTASQWSGGATGVTLHTTYPAARPSTD